ncbi:hypothetical protein PMG11_02168 [Penicillium brasilianum]|uniref:Uncharacterized protein n=1 Tax=Penicillium brasilianum TaxID=104259 RepID=A0A0F7TGP4_PENBI|nr:hypothetical protein PMG11_02168 [Penicillium brasilianum]
MCDQATQRLCLTIHNNLHEGDITLKNLISLSGQPYEKGKSLRLLSTEDVENIRIQPGESKSIGFCGSATLALGIEGMLDLHFGDESRITSLYWNGPKDRLDNQFHVSSTDHEHFTVTASIPPDEGVLGDVSVDVRSSLES